MLLLASAAILAALGVAIGLQQFRAYRDAASGSDTSDLFAYTRRRLVIRLTGVAVLIAIAATLALWEVGAPHSPAAAQSLVTAMLIEVALLVAVALVDLRETARRRR